MLATPDRAAVEIEHLHRVYGPPGTGKTTFLSKNVRRAVERGRRPLIASLTRTAAAEVAGRGLPLPREAVGTLHSHAYRAVGASEIAETHIKEWNQEHPAFGLTDDKRADLDASVEGRPLTKSEGDRLMADMQVMRARMIPRSQWAGALLRFAEVWEAWKQEAGYLDFTDLIEIALADVDAAPGNPDTLLVDEAQDMDRLEMSLIRKWGAQAGYVAIVGDADQNLYQWRGSDPEAFLTPEVAPENKHVLAQSYRVPPAVHRYAVSWIERMPGREPIEYHPRKLEPADAERGLTETGFVRTTPATWKMPEYAIDDAERQLADGRSVMFLTSCAYMLQPLVAVLRRRGLPFHNPYRVEQGAWNPLRYGTPRVLSFLKGQPDVWGDEAAIWCGAELKLWAETLPAKGHFHHGGKTKAMGYHPRQIPTVDELEAWIEFDTLMRAAEGDLDWWLAAAVEKYRHQLEYPIQIAHRFGPRKLFDEPRITVGTIHSVKGGEADVVYVFPDLSLQGFEGWKDRNGEGHQAILRQFYVAFTRAKEGLVLGNYTTPMSVPFPRLPAA